MEPPVSSIESLASRLENHSACLERLHGLVHEILPLAEDSSAIEKPGGASAWMQRCAAQAQDLIRHLELIQQEIGKL